MDGASGTSNGRYAMLLVARYIRRMPAATTCEAFLRGLTAFVRSRYPQQLLPQLAVHPEDRLTCSAVVYSRVNRELWLVGDCQALVGQPVSGTVQPADAARQFQLLDNPKPSEAHLAALRAAEVRRLLATGVTQDELCRNDTARPVIIPRMVETMKQQNIGYSVIDGFPIPRQHVKQVTLDFRPWEIVLASDGYPRLFPTLAESEQWLDDQRRRDPLNIGDFQATKAFHPDFNSFDDRSYIRFLV